MSKEPADIVVSVAPALFVVLWASGFIGTKFGLPYAEPFTFLSLRMIALVFVLGLISLFTRPLWPGRSGFIHSVIAGLLVHGFYLGGVFVAIAHKLPAGLTSLVVSLQPVLTSTLANRVLGERVIARQWFGLLLGLGGVYLVVADKAVAGDATASAWAAAIVALFAITCGTLYQKRFGGNIDWRAGMLIQYAATGALAMTAAFLFETRVIHWTIELVGAVLWLVFVLSLGAIWLLYFMIRHAAATRVTSLFYLTPAVTALMAWFMFGEKLGPLALVGMAVCLAGVFLVNWRVR